jgi:hypothetical protein
MSGQETNIAVVHGIQGLGSSADGQRAVIQFDEDQDIMA